MSQRKNIRLKEYDYSQPGEYFVTVCVGSWKCLLGKVINSKVELSGIGNIVKQYWLEIPEHFNQIEMDEYIIMPNHIHGIISIHNVGTCDRMSQYKTRTCHGMSLPKNNHFSQLQPQSISMMINQFKGSVKRWCNHNDHKYFKWQPKFYEHIVRSEKSLERIRNYIDQNPYYWSRDPNNPINT